MARALWLAACCLLVFSSLPALLAAEEDEENVMVTCGSVIKLDHDRTRNVLHSHEVAYGYGRGSGQQSVTGNPSSGSAGSLWVVRGSKGPCTQGALVKQGKTLKLQHLGTKKWLHSHHFSSPLTNNQEVSCFGAADNTDTGDEWVVEWDDRAHKHWVRDLVVRLKHKDTGVYLASHDVKYQNPIPGQTEVFGSRGADGNTAWRATEGVYLPSTREA